MHGGLSSHKAAWQSKMQLPRDHGHDCGSDLIAIIV